MNTKLSKDEAQALVKLTIEKIENMRRGTSGIPAAGVHEVYTLLSTALTKLLAVVREDKDESYQRAELMVSTATDTFNLSRAFALAKLQDGKPLMDLVDALKKCDREGGSISPAHWLERLGVK